MKKKIVSGLLAMATVMSMSGFMIPAQAADGDALEVWVRNSYYDEMVEASKAFTEKTGIQVNVTEPSNMSDDLALALSSGDTPDVVSIDCVLAPYYASIGALKDITEEFNGLEYKDSFSGGLLDLSNYEGEQYAVPFAPDLSVLIYNKDIFEANGLDPESPPKTWDELIEAAKIDGCGDFKIFLRIIIPVIKPALASWASVTLIARWNDFFWPLLYLRKQAKYTLMVTISLLPVSEGLSTPWPVILAGTTLVIVPIVVLYLLLQTFQKAGLMAGAVKG